MRIPRIYHNGSLTTNTSIDLSEQASKHVSRVLRMQSGDSVELFDGKGQAAVSQIQSIDKKCTTVAIPKLPPLSLRPKIETHLGQVLSKGDRMDYAIQKAVELGVSEITPLFSERCDVKLNAERAQKKWQHWQNIAISACEQCYQNYLPIIHPAMPLALWSEKLQGDLKCTFHTIDATSFSTIALSRTNPVKIALVVGPEGGLSNEEVSALLSKEFVTVSLGPRVLRTETAPVVALSLIQQTWGDLQ